MKYNKCFLHVDMDAFFASVEQRDHPEWRGKPVIVGGLPEDPRGVVSTASYEARRFGVHSAMPTFQAVKLCPEGIFTHGNYQKYSEVSMQIMEILSNYSPDLNQISIDEASLEMTGTELLFGEIDKVAIEIQKRIYNETKLTVSIGLASTAYLAKLASEVNKPNGFYAIEEGQEENFMLSLPLKKVWGIGNKTLERLNKNGFYTTKDIHARSKELLISLFGKSSGCFLYDAVRGKYSESKNVSNHSISNETTFPKDITDLYLAETSLMDLCYSVMFRLLASKSYSKTIFLKIRYEDFTTTSVQETFEDFITSTEDFYEKIKKLFNSKYEKERAIRLLGVGLENIQGEEVPKQEVLFDFGEKKKAAVEKAILNLKNRHPEINIQKARLLNHKFKVLLLSFIGLSALCSKNYTMAEEYLNKVDNSEKKAAALNSPFMLLPLPNEAPSTLFNFNINDKEIDFITEGYWQGQINGSFNASKNKSTNSFSYSRPDFIFQQEVDLSLLFMLNKQWFFEASFVDQFNKNTITAGFYGKELNPLKKLIISNRNIIFPDTYSMTHFSRNIGGGDNEAPGLMAHFEDPFNSKWQGDFAIKYNMTEEHDATFYGKNSLETSTIEFENYITGQFFALPENLISEIKDIYVQSASGTMSDSNGRKYKKLSRDEYLIIEKKHQLVISKDSGVSKKDGKKPYIAVSFYTSEIERELGDYDDSSAEGSFSFLKEVQQCFKNTNLSKYSYNFINKIENQKVLFLQASTGFSPFAWANYYDIGIASSRQIKIAGKNSEKSSENYFVEITENFQEFLDSSFINNKHEYAEIYTEEKAEIYSAKKRFPLADSLPEVYLNTKKTSDYAIIVEKYTPVTSFNIGCNAEEYSVKVYKNGILLRDCSYDKDSGIVTIEASVSELDKIYITWNEDSGDKENGAIQSQAGFKYFFNPYLKSDISLACNWTISPYAQYSEYERSASGYLAFSSGINYEKEKLSFSSNLAAVYEKLDVTDKYRIEGFDNSSPATSYLGKNSGRDLSENQIPSINPRPDSSDSSIQLNPEYNSTVKEAVANAEKDLHISGYKIPLEWDMTATSEDWAAINISLLQGKQLKSASIFRIAIQLLEPLTENLDLYLQLGTDASENPDPEESDKIPTWKLDIDRNNYKTESNSGWQILEVNLTDLDRAFLTCYKDARLIIKSNSNENQLLTGIIYTGPYEIITADISYYCSDEAKLTSEEIKDNTVPEHKTFNKDDNYIQKITWNYDSSIDEKIYVGKFLSPVNLEDYKYLKFFFRNTDFSDFSLVLDSDSALLQEDGDIALKLEFTDTEFIKTLSDSWHTLKIDLNKKSLQIDDIDQNGNFILTLNKKKNPSRLRFIFQPNQLSDSFYFDEFYLEEAKSNFLLENVTDFHYQKEGEILTFNNFSVIKDFYIDNTIKSGSTLPLEKEYSNNEFISSDNSLKITILNIKASGDIALSSSEEKVINSASHTLETEKAIFDIFEAKDSFVFDRTNSSMEKSSSASIKLEKLKIPLTLSAKTWACKNLWNYSNDLSSKILFNLNQNTWNLHASASLSANQKENPSEENHSILLDKNYFSAYKAASDYSFNMGSQNASIRNVENYFSSGFKIPFLSIAPEYYLSLKEKYTNTTSTKYSDNLDMSLALPFKINRQNFLIKYSRKENNSKLTDHSGDYKKDFSELYESIEKSDWYFKIAPFQDLFDSGMSNRIFEQVQKNDYENIYYNGKYSFSWKRQLFADIKDIFLPASFEFSSERALSLASDSSDNYILKAKIINTPINLFGAQSKTKLFKWYNSDEFTFSLSGTAKIPQTEISATQWNLDSYLQASFFMKDNNYLKTASEYSLKTDHSWTFENTIQYKREIKRSPVYSLVKIFYNLDKKKIKMTRNDSLDLVFNYDRDENFLNHSYEYAHTITSEIDRFFTLNLGFETDLIFEKEITSLLLKGNIGGKIIF